MRIEDVCTVFTDGDWIESKDQSSTGIRLVQTGNIGTGVYLEKEDKAKYISEDTFKKLKCTEIFPGDILVSRLPDPIGRACIVPQKEERMITAVDCTICRPNMDILSTKYLCYFMQSDAYYHRLLNSVAGTTRKRISRKNLGKVELAIPNKTTQRKVTETLDSLTSLISKRKEELSKIDALVKSRFIEMFGDGLDGEGYDTVESCCANVTGGGTPSMKHPEYYGGDIPFIKSGDVKGNILMNGALSLTQTALDETTAKLVPKDSVIVVVRSATLTHKFMIAISGQPMVINQDLKALEPNERVVAGYLMMAIKLREQHLLGHAQTMLTTHINIRDLLDMKIPVPSIDAQKEFMKFAKQADKSKLVLQQLIEKKELLQSALMQEFFG